MGNRSYPKLVDGLESADDDGSVQGANRAISASLTADSIQKEPGKFVERTAWLFVIISCLDGLDSDLLFQLIKFFNYLHTFLDKPSEPLSVSCQESIPAVLFLPPLSCFTR